MKEKEIAVTGIERAVAERRTRPVRSAPRTVVYVSPMSEMSLEGVVSGGIAGTLLFKIFGGSRVRIKSLAGSR